MDEEKTGTQIQEADILEKAILFFVKLIQLNIKKILLAGLIGGIIGVSISTQVTKQYSCSVQILPEFSNEGGSSFSSLANLAGIDLSQNSETDAFRPDLYPTVLTSTTAVVHLLRQPVTTFNKKHYSSLIAYMDSFSEIKTSAGELAKTPITASVWRFTASEQALIENVRRRIKANFDKKSGIVVLDVEMPDQEIAASCSALLTQYLQNFLSDYRLKKKVNQSKFLTKRVSEAKGALNRAEYALQNYRDKNRNVVANVARIQEQKLQFEFIQRQNLYNDLLNQLEKSKIDELQNEDILITVESPVVPLKASSPRKLFYGLGGAIVATLLLIVALFKPWKFFK
jgi:hypothetical protein